MRKCRIFVGSSHPDLGKLICDRLGLEPAPCNIFKFANGETGCDIGVSVRDTHCIIIMGSANLINDRIMELLVLISGCRSGSASKITCVIPMFPYSKQSKMKTHRGAITARMLANLITNAGADHVITMDLHASQMQGFFSIPVDNLSSGPTLARWIRLNVPDYRSAVIVSRNPGGTKRVTALADALKVNFAMIHTDRRRQKNKAIKELYPERHLQLNTAPDDIDESPVTATNATFGELEADELGANTATANVGIGRSLPIPILQTKSNIHIARVLRGHVVADEDPARTASPDDFSERFGTPATTEQGHALGGSAQAGSDDDEEIDYSKEQVIALVGDVRGRTAIILDGMIDRPESFIAAAEHCKLSCGAKAVYVVATHGVFGANSLEALDSCTHIDRIVVTNTYPIERTVQKLTVIDISAILAECVRRNHNGESISNLFEQLSII